MKTQNTQTITEQEEKEFLKKVRKYAKNRYPVVMKNIDIGKIMILYENRVEWYNLKNKESKSELDSEFKDTEEGEWTPHHEIEMAKNCGFKRVNDTTEKDDWRFD